MDFDLISLLLLTTHLCYCQEATANATICRQTVTCENENEAVFVKTEFQEAFSLHLFCNCTRICDVETIIDSARGSGSCDESLRNLTRLYRCDLKQKCLDGSNRLKLIRFENASKLIGVGVGVATFLVVIGVALCIYISRKTKLSPLRHDDIIHTEMTFEGSTENVCDVADDEVNKNKVSSTLIPIKEQTLKITAV